MDVDAYVAAAKDSGANVMIFNVGGIVANDPTELPFQWRNPLMKDDPTGAADGAVTCTIPELGAYNIVVFE